MLRSIMIPWRIYSYPEPSFSFSLYGKEAGDMGTGGHGAAGAQHDTLENHLIG